MVAACLATATARRSGSWMMQEPTTARSVAMAATVRTTMHSRQGPCQNRWSQAHSAPAPATSAWWQRSARSDSGSASDPVPSPGSTHAGTVSWTRVGRISPMAPGGSNGCTGGTLHGTPEPFGSRPSARPDRPGRNGGQGHCESPMYGVPDWHGRMEGGGTHRPLVPVPRTDGRTTHVDADVTPGSEGQDPAIAAVPVGYPVHRRLAMALTAVPTRPIRPRRWPRSEGLGGTMQCAPGTTIRATWRHRTDPPDPRPGHRSGVGGTGRRDRIGR